MNEIDLRDEVDVTPVDVVTVDLVTMARQVAEIHAAMTAIAELVEKVGPALENSPIMAMLGIKL